MSTSTIDTETLENSVQTGVNQLLRGGWGEALKTILFALLLLVICLVIKAILLKLLDRGLNRFSPVSYTHLDVYKRQGLPRGDKVPKHSPSRR